MANTSRRGFASMDPEKQREIASRGGRAAHAKGTAHRFTPEEARIAGRKGGEASRGGRGRNAGMTTNEEPGVLGSGGASGSMTGGAGGYGGGVSDVSSHISPDRSIGAERSVGSERESSSERQHGGGGSLERESSYDNGSEGRGSF